MNVTIIVPSLDPDEKLMQVVEGLLAEGFTDIVLVNDGSHDDHLAPFREAAEHPEVTVLTHEVNKGKGRAMKTAFAWCIQNRPDIDGVVTVDGDNQHRPADVRRCAEAMLADPDKVWLGVRDFSLEQVPLRSRFGNTVTRNVVWLACGSRITDTQTGLRAIARRHLELMCRIEGERYEYETEMLMALRQAGVGIGEVVIDTVYIDENESSHFNAFKDSWKIYKIIFRHMFRSLGSFLKFSASAIVSVLVDQGLFALLNAVILASLPDSRRFFISTFAARLVSSVVNYSANRNLVFRSGKKGSLLRYYILCIAQTSCSYLLVWLFSMVLRTSGLGDNLVKIVVDTLLFLASYQFQKRWVFRSES